MDRKIKAAGDTWQCRLSAEASEPDVRPLVFFCVTNDQRPYRVVEVSRDRIDGPDALAALSDEDLEALFEAARSMGFPRDYPTYGG
jgi:hypothetical protein